MGSAPITPQAAKRQGEGVWERCGVGAGLCEACALSLYACDKERIVAEGSNRDVGVLWRVVGGMHERNLI